MAIISIEKDFNDISKIMVQIQHVKLTQPHTQPNSLIAVDEKEIAILYEGMNKWLKMFYRS